MCRLRPVSRVYQQKQEDFRRIGVGTPQKGHHHNVSLDLDEALLALSVDSIVIHLVTHLFGWAERAMFQRIPPIDFGFDFVDWPEFEHPKVARR